jgi:tetratricopeptide (TPR) repeat protein
MRFKATNYLLITFVLFFGVANTWAMSALDTDLADSVQKKDWPAVVLLLDPHQGQNFEHDFTLAKALLSLERRQEALKLLSTLADEHKDERVTKLFQTAGTIFFSQETSNAYYESLDLIRTLKFSEARDHLEQALSKEPGQILLLTRLIQMELLLGKTSAATTNLKLAQDTSQGMTELKLFAVKMAVDKKPDDDDDQNLLYRDVVPLKTQLLENEITLPFWSEALTRAKRNSEIETFAAKTLKDHPLWSYALMDFAKSRSVSPSTQIQLIAQLEKNLKSKDAFDAALEAEMKRTDYFWVGYSVYENLLVDFKKVSATPTPTVQ